MSEGTLLTSLAGEAAATPNPDTAPEEQDVKQQEQEVTKDSQTTGPEATEDKKADAPAEGDEAAKTADEAPAEWDLKIPEGLTIPETVLEALKGVTTDGAAAQGLIDTFAKAQAAAEEAAQADWEAKRAAARKEIESSAGFKEGRDAAQRALVAWADEEFKELLDSTGLGDHPAVFRFFAKAGAGLRDDTIAGSASAGVGGANTLEERLRVLYPTMPQFKE